MTKDTEDAKLSLMDVAALCDVHVSSVWRWTLKGVKGSRLVSERVGGRRRVRCTELAAFLARINQELSADDRLGTADVCLAAASAGDELTRRKV